MTERREPLPEYNHKTVPRMREQDRFDLLGRYIEENDIIAYPTTSGQSAVMRVAQVVTVEPVMHDVWVHGDSQKAQYVKRPDPAGGWVMFVTYFEESMRWGLSKHDPEWDEGWHTEALATNDFGPHWWRDAVRDVSPKHLINYREQNYGFAPEFFTPEQKAAYDRAYLEWVEYHEKAIAKAQREQAKPVKPKLYKLLFPGKAMIINHEWERHTRSDPFDSIPRFVVTTDEHRNPTGLKEVRP